MNNSYNGKVTNEYLTSYPKFLKPNKLYPHRRIDDSHVKNAMEIALDRYEKELLIKEGIKDKETS
jgi:hypothetical protein